MRYKCAVFSQLENSFTPDNSLSGGNWKISGKLNSKKEEKETVRKIPEQSEKIVLDNTKKKTNNNKKNNRFD